MNFELPDDLKAYIRRLDTFITIQILPLQHQDDNNRFFDHRREPSRTQWDHGGVPTRDWEALLSQARRMADDAGFYRFPMPKQFGGAEQPDLNLWMCAMRYHMASHPVYGGGVSLANDLQNEHSVVGNFPDVLMLYHYGNEQQRREFIPARLRGQFRATFGLTEIHHGSDATHMDTTATAGTLSDGQPGYIINGNKKWQTGMHTATHMILFARTSGRAGHAKGITAFIVPTSNPGVKVQSYEYTLNMPTDHATVLLENVQVPASAILGPLDNGLAIAQTFTHENRIRQASSSCGAAVYCINASIEYAKQRKVFSKPLAVNQAIQWPVVELHTQATMLRLLILQTAHEMDLLTQSILAQQSVVPALNQSQPQNKQSTLPTWVAIEQSLGHKISMCNYFANRLATQAADAAIQIHGGMGYSRHLPFEHIWRHFRRYRITEGSEEVQMRKVAAHLFGFRPVAPPTATAASTTATITETKATKDESMKSTQEEFSTGITTSQEEGNHPPRKRNPTRPDKSDQKKSKL